MCYITSSSLQHVLEMPSSTNASTLTPLANSTFSNVHVTQSGSLAVDPSFQFVDVRS